MRKQKIFISHCETIFAPTDFAIRVIDLIDCIPVIAEKQPKLSRTVPGLVCDSMDSCDAVIVIATPDRDGPSGKECSQGVLVEIGQLQKSEKFKGKYIIIKDKNVVFSPMIPEAIYSFIEPDLSPIAEAILIELGSMGFFRNYYALPGSDLQLHELMDTLSKIKDLAIKGHLKPDVFKDAIEDIIKRTVDEVTRGVC